MKRKIRILFLFLAALLLFFPSPAHAEVVRKNEKAGKKIALSFDDGPSRRNTEEILSILKEYHVHATFFVIGENAQRDPERIRSIFCAGHEIGNHTYTHAYLTKINKQAIREEILKTEKVLIEITGEKPTLFRPPGGYYDADSLRVLDEMGYTSVLWSLDTKDWRMPKTETIVSKVEGNASDGDIILFHDLEDARFSTPKALRIIIPYLIENGYEIVTVSELLREGA